MGIKFKLAVILSVVFFIFIFFTNTISVKVGHNFLLFFYGPGHLKRFGFPASFYKVITWYKN